MSEEKKEEFELIYTPHKARQKVRIQVEVFYRSEQVVRFRVRGGQKFIELEKRLNRRDGDWKILDSNFEFKTQSIEQSAFGIRELQLHLDGYLNKDKQRSPGNPKYEH